jgi:hypothetical protein
MKVIYEAFFIVTALVSNPVLSASSDHEDHDSLRVRGFQPRHDRAMRSKSSKQVAMCFDEGLVEFAEGSKAASSAAGITGVSTLNSPDNLPVEHRIGSRWMVNGDEWNAANTDSYNQLQNPDTAVNFKFTKDHASTGDSSLCIKNQCDGGGCEKQKGYLQVKTASYLFQRYYCYLIISNFDLIYFRTI